MAQRFETHFEQATGNVPYPYQVRLAERAEVPEVLTVPTGVGKTTAAVIA